MDKFLSCDWGTSSFRLRLVQAPALTTIAAIHTGNGIAATWQAWQNAGLQGSTERWRFYTDRIRSAIQSIEQQAGPLPGGIPLIISGMASSSIGMMELPYGSLPFATDGRGILTRLEPAGDNLPHDVLLISGIRSEDDVMRGEETQLIGCIGGTRTAGEATYIFPGTHSKHIQVKNGAATGFQTFMTGELFELLRRHSILKDAVAAPEGASQSPLSSSFREGVMAGAKDSLLHAIFRVRTNQLFGHLTSTENLDYLSGLLIGAELQSLAAGNGQICLCGGSHLEKHYAAALDVLGLMQRSNILPAQWIEEAVIRGQYSIFNHLTVQHHAW
ncbi:2-dehydro-3-deoxygalactonokinase [uncultured Chitinophaga sp.]|jgi:2-keto-3-deoxy-galactonokinase|uniref:2-dehydro-3-deoxygalactonokinase n=1 Tax=uncultured Chitinophaga sp. TaxID=339340 RepID=UPI0026147D85|nr:2-dehydro-3-deoxygalactonokinase [uncultured Chitinophaga sp.]